LELNQKVSLLKEFNHNKHCCTNNNNNNKTTTTTRTTSSTTTTTTTSTTTTTTKPKTKINTKIYKVKVSQNYSSKNFKRNVIKTSTAKK